MNTLTIESGEPAHSKSDLSFLQLQVELMRVDLRIHRALQLWQQANDMRGADNFRGHYISDAEIGALLKKPLGAGWWQAPAGAGADDYADVVGQAARQAQSLRQTARQQGKITRFDHLVTAFELDHFEVDALLVCLAPAVDRRYERFYGYLQDDATRRWPSINMLLDLLCEPGPERLLRLKHFDAEARLRRNHLVRRASEPGYPDPPLLNWALRPDDTIVAWLLGRFHPHADVANFVALVEPQDVETNLLLAGETLLGLERVESGQPSVYVFQGRDDSSQWAAASLLAAKAGQPLLRVDLASAAAAGSALPRVLTMSLRDARLTGAIPYVFGWDACLADGAPPPNMLEAVCAYPGHVVVAGREAWQSRGIERENNLHWFDFPLPAYSQRRRLWQHFLGARLADEIDTTDVAGQFILATGQIRDAVALARDIAAQRGDPVQLSDLFAAARAHSSPNLSSLARKIVSRYVWDDIVLPSDQITMLHELVATVRGRPIVLDEWGVGEKLASSNGVTVLFAGPPGTGKTMAAEVIAAELGLDLYKIDLSTIVSKYIGETEKNLEKVFKEAESSNAILFFDEADAIFGKRSEVRDSHDRYANIEISYLLQRMEAYDGVTILATNLRANLDEAFTRRLQFAVDFPFPEDEDRLRIWRALFPADVPRAPDLDLELMARRFKLAGGSIRNIIVSAAFLAATNGGQITMDHLLHGARRELQKMGRLVSDSDLRRS